MKRRVAGFAFLVLLVPGCFSAETPNTQKAIEDRLTCQCGCGLTVHSCNHLQCGFAVPVRREIAEALAAGKAADEIIAGYVEKYGEKVLSSPVPTGFNLVAWYGPYVVVALGALGILLLIRRWIGGRQEGTASATIDARVLSDGDRKRLDRELKDLEE